MSSSALTRREFLERSAGGLALFIAVGPVACRQSPEGESAGAQTKASDTLASGQWLRVAANGRATFFNDKSEMGQGAETALAMVIAEELGVPMSAVDVEHARPGPAFDDMGTSGSDSVAGRWEPR